MGLQRTYHQSWDLVFAYLEDPADLAKHRSFYSAVEPLITHWLLRFNLKEGLEYHARSIFADLYLKEQKRYLSGSLTPERCTAQITSYYYPVIKNLCIDYTDALHSTLPLKVDSPITEPIAVPGVFDTLWGDHKNTLLLEMNRSLQDYIELSDFTPPKKEYLRKRYLLGLKLPEIFNGLERKELEAQRKWVLRQGKKIAERIAQSILPAIIEGYKLPINKKVDPKIIEKYLLGLRTKMPI